MTDDVEHKVVMQTRSIELTVEDDAVTLKFVCADAETAAVFRRYVRDSLNSGMLRIGMPRPLQ